VDRAQRQKAYDEFCSRVAYVFEMFCAFWHDLVVSTGAYASASATSIGTYVYVSYLGFIEQARRVPQPRSHVLAPIIQLVGDLGSGLMGVLSQFVLFAVFLCSPLTYFLESSVFLIAMCFGDLYLPFSLTLMLTCNSWVSVCALLVHAAVVAYTGWTPPFLRRCFGGVSKKVSFRLLDSEREMRRPCKCDTPIPVMEFKPEVVPTLEEVFDGDALVPEWEFASAPVLEVTETESFGFEARVNSVPDGIGVRDRKVVILYDEDGNFASNGFRVGDSLFTCNHGIDFIFQASGSLGKRLDLSKVVRHEWHISDDEPIDVAQMVLTQQDWAVLGTTKSQIAPVRSESAICARWNDGCQNRESWGAVLPILNLPPYAYGNYNTSGPGSSGCKVEDSSGGIVGLHIGGRDGDFNAFVALAPLLRLFRANDPSIAGRDSFAARADAETPRVVEAPVQLEGLMNASAYIVYNMVVHTGYDITKLSPKQRFYVGVFEAHQRGEHASLKGYYADDLDFKDRVFSKGDKSALSSRDAKKRRLNRQQQRLGKQLIRGFGGTVESSEDEGDVNEYDRQNGIFENAIPTPKTVIDVLHERLANGRDNQDFSSGSVFPPVNGGQSGNESVSSTSCTARDWHAPLETLRQEMMAQTLQVTRQLTEMEVSLRPGDLDQRVLMRVEAQDHMISTLAESVKVLHQPREFDLGLVARVESQDRKMDQVLLVLSSVQSSLNTAKAMSELPSRAENTAPSPTSVSRMETLLESFLSSPRITAPGPSTSRPPSAKMLKSKGKVPGKLTALLTTMSTLTDSEKKFVSERTKQELRDLRNQKLLPQRLAFIRPVMLEEIKLRLGPTPGVETPALATPSS
jgi:hypothetical protein